MFDFCVLLLGCSQTHASTGFTCERSWPAVLPVHGCANPYPKGELTIFFINHFNLPFLF